jgi:molecular chaperone GrpE
MARRRRQDEDQINLEATGHVETDESPEGEGRAPEEGSGDEAAELKQQVGELQLKYQRALADYRNYQQRALTNERQARASGEADVLHSIVRILDYFDMALQQDPEKVSAEQIMGGVRLIKEELLRAIGSHGVSRIEPSVGEEFDPLRHEAVEQVRDAEGARPGEIARLAQPGYQHADRVLRPAKVAVVASAEGGAGVDVEDEDKE